jgi:hypothetical protein
MVSARAAVSFEKDTSRTELRQLNKQGINTYKKDKEFKYRDDAPHESGIMAIISYMMFRFLSKVFGSHVGGTSIYTILLYVLMIFGVVMIIFQFLRISPQGLLSRSSAVIAVDSIEGDNIHEINFDKLIQQSAAQQDYRLAVRFWYLKMLKVMSDADLIHWEISKTISVRKIYEELILSSLIAL